MISEISHDANVMFTNTPQWDALIESSHQFSKLILEASEENQRRITDVIIDHILTKLPNGDSKSGLIALAKLLILKLPQTKDSDTSLAHKTLLDERILCLSFPNCNYQKTFDKKFYSESTYSIELHLNEFDKLMISINNCSFPETKDHIEQAKLLMENFKLLETQIPLWRDNILQATKELLGEIEQWTKYFVDQYTKIAHQHDLLADKKSYAYETYSSKLIPAWLNYYGAKVKIPDPKNISDHYFATNFSTFENGRYLDKTNVTTLFSDYQSFIIEIENFAVHTYAHLAETSGTRHAICECSPILDGMKQKAQGLYGNYKEMHDQCLNIFSRFNTFTENLKKVQTLIVELADSNLKELSQKGDQLYQFTKDF